MSGASTEWSGQVGGAVSTTTFVRVETSQGLVGHGATASYSSGCADLSQLEAARVLGSGLLRDETLEPAALLRMSHEMPLTPQYGALSALDIALWDVLGQRAGMPLYQLLGGVDRPMRGYASMPFLGSAENYLQSIDELRRAGYTAFKLHTWCEYGKDVELVKDVSEALAGTGLALMLDVEQSYSRVEAARMARILDTYEWRWFEAPLPDTDVEGYASLRQRCLTPVLNSGNRVIDPRGVMAGARSSAWDAVRFDTTVAGGITAARSLSAIARMFDLPVELQSWGHSLIEAANLHAALGFTTSEFFEIAVPRDPYELGVSSPIRIDGAGQVRANQRAGLGVSLDWDAVEQAAVVHHILT
ncbi:MAG: enolase C-terminal domain-like protein [Arachnia sp.]